MQRERREKFRSIYRTCEYDEEIDEDKLRLRRSHGGSQGVSLKT